MTREDALVELLALPDPIDLIGRGCHVTCASDPRADPERLKRDLGTAYVTWRRHDHADQSAVVSVRRHTRHPIARCA